VANEIKRPEKSDSEEPSAETSPAGQGKFGWIRGKTAQHWLAGLLVCTLAAHGIGLVYYTHSAARAQVECSPEIALGDYEFRADSTAGGRFQSAEFSLYITALEGLDGVARKRLASHKCRVQEEIESLLRRSHSGDFDDPVLGDLKRQIRDQINHALGNRVVSEVIITNLRTTPSNNKELPATADAVSSAPWLEKSSTFVSQKSGN
jgi:flagellar basal body-associated protein FliL